MHVCLLLVFGRKSSRCHEVLWQSHWCSFGAHASKGSWRSFLENSVCGARGGGRLMLCIFLGMVMWQRFLVHEKGICAFEEPKMPETAEYRVRGLSRGLYRTLQGILWILSSQSSTCLQPGERGREVGWGPRVEAGIYVRTRWCGLV